MTSKEKIELLRKMVQENEEITAQDLLDQMQDEVENQEYLDNGQEVIEFKEEYKDLAKWFYEVCDGFRCCVELEENKVIFS